MELSRGVGESVHCVGLDRAPLGDLEHRFRSVCSGNTGHRVCDKESSVVIVKQ